MLFLLGMAHTRSERFGSPSYDDTGALTWSYFTETFCDHFAPVAHLLFQPAATPLNISRSQRAENLFGAQIYRDTHDHVDVPSAAKIELLRRARRQPVEA